MLEEKKGGDKQCCGSEIILFGSGSYFGLKSGFGLLMKNTFEMQII
jgi:hypothetical protein